MGLFRNKIKMEETQILRCHDCGNNIEFPINPEKDGNFIIVCDQCHHEHCRVCRNGEVSDIRWSRRGRNYFVKGTATKYKERGQGDRAKTFLQGSWLNKLGRER